ncbi:MAG: hypothetical protein ACRDOY_11025 [Nocardioidaceae bacterium]
MVRSLALAGAAVLLGALAGCGDGGTEASSTDAYCSELKSVQKEFDALGSGNINGANLDKAFDRMQELADQAPEAVADDWAKIDNALTQMEAGLKDLGIGFEDITNPEKLQDVDPAKLQEFGAKMQKFAGKEFDAAGKNIQRHAKQECGIKSFGN